MQIFQIWKQFKTNQVTDLLLSERSISVYEWIISDQIFDKYIENDSISNYWF